MKSLCLAATIALLAAPAHAYNLDGERWKTQPVTMQLQLGAPASPLIDGSVTWDAVAADALDLWNASLVNFRFAAVRGSTVAQSPTNRLNNVFFSPTIYGDAFGSRVLGITLLRFSSTNGISNGYTEADVIFNANVPWNSYRGPLRIASGTEFLNDLRRVALHEFGHALGLNHPDDIGQSVTAVMNALSGNLDTLAFDDINGAKALYDGGAAVGPPVFTTQPAAKTIALGSTVLFTSLASATPAPAYQWRLNGVAIAGATNANLVLVGASAAQAGAYTCLATNPAGSTPSATAVLTVQATANAGRIDNLSVLTTLAPGEPYFTVGTVIGGAGTSGAKPLLVRAVGPTLGAAPFGIGGTLPDPKLDFFSGQTVVATNDNWGTPAAGVPVLSAAFTTRQAFPFVSAASKDAAVFNPAIASGSYTVQVSDAAGGTGLVLAELYDNTAVAFTPATPRLVNVSVLKVVPAGGLITVGFNIGGTTARTVLIRAMGPTLATAFNVPGAMADPKLDLFPAGATAPTATNDNWGGDAQVLALNNAITFAPASAASKDAILLITLPPGGYTVQVSPVAGTPGGNVIAEVYEIP